MTFDIPTVKVEFHGLPNFICTLKWWKEIGGYKGWLTLMSIQIKSIKKVQYCLMDAINYPTQAWEG